MPSSSSPRRQVVYARQLHTQYLVARRHPSPERLRAQLDEATGDVLQGAMTTLLAPHIDPTDDAVWFIRQLDVDISMSTAWDREQLARAWAQRITLALVQTLSAGDDGVNVVRFRSHTDYVSHFLADLVAGHAWSRWYYESFEGVRPLPLSSAIRTVIQRDPVVGIDALLALPPATLIQVISTLSVQDARQLIPAIPSTGVMVAPRACFELLWRTYEALHGDTGVDGDARNTLRLSLEAIRAHPDWSGDMLIATARALATLIRLAATTPGTLPLIHQALARGGAAALYTVVSSSDAEALAPLADVDPAWFEFVMRALTLGITHTPAHDPATEIDIRSTPFGGAFLLFPIIARLPLSSATAGWPSCNDVSAESLVRLLILSKCLGGSSLPRLTLDATMRDLLQLDPQLQLPHIIRWLNELRSEHLVLFQTILAAAVAPSPPSSVSSQASPTLTPLPRLTRRDARYLAFPPVIRERSSVRRTLGRVAVHILRDFSRRLPGFSHASFAHLHTNFLSISASIEQQPTRQVVRLSRPPLDIILNMTGMSRATYRFPWLGDRPLVLFPESAA